MTASQAPQPNVAWRMIRKIGVTLIGGTVTYFLAERLIADNGPMSIMTSVFVAGVIFVTHFLVDVDKRLDRLDRAQRRHLDGIDEKLGRSTVELGHGAQLMLTLAKSRLDSEATMNLVRDMVAVDEELPPIAGKIAEAELDRLSVFMRQLSRHGRFTYEGEDRDLLLALAGSMSTSLKACSLPTVDNLDAESAATGFWRSDLGQRYLDSQERAVGRGVRIQRLFITDPTSDLKAAATREGVRRQRGAGIEIRVLNQDRLDGTEFDIEDFIVFDGSVSYTMRNASGLNLPKPLRTLVTEISVVPDKVNRYDRLFDSLWDKATVPDLESGD